MSLFALKHVFKEYRVENRKIQVLVNINLSFPNSSLVTVTGKSGSGKSTLLNIISLVDNATDGTLLFKNKDVSTFKSKEVDLFHLKEIGIVHQEYHLLLDETVLFNISLPLKISGIKPIEAEEKVKEFLRKQNFPENLFNSKCFNLSGGEAQRVAIFRAIINNPTCLIADEPTGALDSENGEKIMELLKEISKERLVIVASHNVDLVNRFSDRIIEMSGGRIISDEKNKEQLDNTFSL